MNTTPPQVVKNMLIRFHHENSSIAEVARAEHVAYNTAKRILKVYSKSDLVNEELPKVGYSKIADVFGYNHKGDNKDYFPIHFDEVFFLLNDKHYTRQEAYETFYTKAAEKAAKDDPSLKAYSYSQFCKKLVANTPKTPDYKLNHEPGYALQVDFAGRKGDVEWTDKECNVNRLEMFVASLPSSGLIFAYPVANQRIENWLLCHEKAFEFLGGVTQVTVPDNLKSAVTTPQGKGRELVLNPAYKEQAETLDFIIKPAPPGKPKGKAHVERAVRIVESWMVKVLSNEKFFSFEHLLRRINQLLICINYKRYKGSSRIARFIEDEKPHLQPLPELTVKYGEWLLPVTVSNAGYARVDKAYYQLEDKYLGKKVIPKIYAESVEFYYDGMNQSFLVQSHARTYIKGKHIQIENYRRPTPNQYQTHNYQYYLEWAKNTGSEPLVSLIQAQLKAKKSDYAVREACKGIYEIYLGCKHSKKHELSLFFDACDGVASSNHRTLTRLREKVKFLKKQAK